MTINKPAIAPIKTSIKTWTRPILGILLAGLGVTAWTDHANAADIVCRGTMFGDTNFAAYYGEVGFGRMELTYRRGGSVEVPLQYVRQNNRGEAIFRGNNPDQPSDVVEVISPAKVQPGTQIQVRYNGNGFTGNCFSTSGSRPPGNSTLTEGSFIGRGRASGSVFGRGRQANASLNFNQGRFSLGLSVPPGTGAEVRYQGTINRLRGTSRDNPNSFVLEGQVRSFASSANNRRVINTGGTCRIEVFDARVTSTSCNTSVRGSDTQFEGMKQF